MTRKQTQNLSAAARALTTVAALVLCATASYPGNTNEIPAGTGTSSSNLRDIYYGTVHEKKPALVGRVGVELLDQNGSRQVPIEYAFRSGDKFRFLVSSNKHGFLYILYGSSDGQVKQLWPHLSTDNKASEAFEIRAKQTYMVPPSPGVFIFDDKVGDERFYIAVRSEPKAPSLGMLDRPDEYEPRQIPAAIDIRDQPGTKEVQWLIRDPFVEGTTRGVTFDPGSAIGDLYRYFSAVASDTNTKAMVQLRLIHRK